MTENWKVVFSNKLYGELNKFLFSTTNENGCFLLGNYYNTKQGKNVVLINHIIKPNKDSWKSIGPGNISPTSTFINQAVTIAEEEDSSLFFVHTHPNHYHPSKFSFIDEKTNGEIFENLSGILDRPLGSLVFSRRGVYGVTYYKKRLSIISKFTILGHIIFEYNPIANNHKNKLETKFDRQYNAIGKENHLRLQNMTVSVVGAGGTGSALVVQLARMGIKELQLFDHDVITKTNIPRVYGSTDNDCNKPKVNVLKNHIESFSKTKVTPFQVDITKNNVISSLLDSDVIFACTDNMSSRALLNDIALQYYIPLIDVGCRIDLDDMKKIFQAIVKVQIITPDDACLWCTKSLDAKAILQESLSEKEKRNLAKEGYYQPVENQPSIISITTMVASMAINKLLSLIGTFDPQYNSVTQIELKDGFMIEETPKPQENCICHKRKGLAGKREVIIQ